MARNLDELKTALYEVFDKAANNAKLTSGDLEARLTKAAVQAAKAILAIEREQKKRGSEFSN